MRNLKIRMKMLLGFGTILILLVMLNGLSLSNLRKLSNMAIEMYEGPYTHTAAAVELTKDIKQLDIVLNDMILSEDVASLENEYNASLTSAKKQISFLKESGELAGSELSELESGFSQMESSGKAIQENLKKGSVEAAYEEMSDQFDVLMEKCIPIAENLEKNAGIEAQGFVTKADKLADLVIIFQDILFGVIVLAAVAIALKMSVDISRPVRRLAKGMDQVAAGKFDVDLKNPWQDELGTLARQLDGTVDTLKGYITDISYVLGEISQGNIAVHVDREYIGEFQQIKSSLLMIIRSLNDTMGQIQICCGQVKTSAENLSNNAQSLAHGSVEQAAAVDEFKQSLDKVAALTKQDGENATKVKNYSFQAWNAMQESDRQMGEMVKAMTEIDGSSKEIAKIIKLIEDIAFQTNILALNAAVEAARAGAAGKGFAVVADEVRNLAGKSAEAASNTSAMIGNAVSSVARGMQIAEATAHAMKGVGLNVKTMTDLLENIDKSTNEQARAFTQMVGSVEQIDSVVHLNSAAAEENSSSSEELSAQAEMLEQLINHFKMHAPSQTEQSRPGQDQRPRQAALSAGNGSTGLSDW